MPDFLNGSSSSFPSSLDNFVIKRPYDPNIDIFLQNPNALERASHFNHYFDAAIKIQETIPYGVGPIQTKYPWAGTSQNTTSIWAPYLHITHSTLTATMTTTTLTVSGTVPAIMGDDPFNTWGFSMGTTLYVHSTAGTEEIDLSLYNETTNRNKLWNHLMNQTQFYTMVQPLTGRNYNVIVKAININGLTTPFIDTFTLTPEDTQLNAFYDSESILTSYGSHVEGAESQAKTMRVDVANISPMDLYFTFECTSDANSPRGGFFKSKFKAADTQVTFPAVWASNFPGGSNVVATKTGPMVGFSGNINNCSFYVLSIGDVLYPTNPTPQYYARLLKVQGANLANGISPSSLNWGAATVTVLASSIYVGDTGATKYRLKIEGSDITVEKFNGSWTTHSGPHTDGSPINSATSTCGWVVQALTSTPTMSKRAIYIDGDIVLENLDSTVSVPITIQCLFTKVSPESALTKTTV